MKAWALTLGDVVGVGAAYWFLNWLSGAEATLEGFTLAVTIVALLGVARLKTGE